MQSPKACFTIPLFIFALITASTSRAGEIPFSWQTSFNPRAFPLNSYGEGFVDLVPWNGSATNPAYQFVQESLGASDGSAYPLHGVGGVNQPFTMTLRLTDGPSGLSDVLTFHGTVATYSFFGTGDAHLGGEYYTISDGSRQVMIGNDTYDIHMLNGVLFTFGDPFPDVNAQIEVMPGSHSPEPSSLLLAALGLPALGLARRKKLVVRMNKS